MKMETRKKRSKKFVKLMKRNEWMKAFYAGVTLSGSQEYGTGKGSVKLLAQYTTLRVDMNLPQKKRAKRERKGERKGSEGSEGKAKTKCLGLNSHHFKIIPCDPRSFFRSINTPS